MQHRNRARALMTLVAGVLVAGLLVIVLGPAGCSDGGDKGTTSSKGSTAGTGSGTGTLEGQVGKPLAVGAVKMTVTGLSAVAKPLLPWQVVDPDAIPAWPGTGVVFYQAWVRIQNGGKSVVGVDPRDFSLTSGGKIYSPDLARSGPPTVSLIPTASLDLILTFKVPAGVTPDLLYRPPWYGGRIVVKGQKKPAGVASAPSPGLPA